MIVYGSFQTEIQQLVLEGQIKEAEEETKILYPNLLDSNPDLLFMLRCRHFVELVGQSMARKSRLSDETEGDVAHNKCCNGDGDRESLDSGEVASNNRDEDMEVIYSNGYPNGCGDEMGKICKEIVCLTKMYNKVLLITFRCRSYEFIFIEEAIK